MNRGFRITGRVQGVGFRWWTRGMAQDLGLRGSVRNCADGSVEVHASGSDEAVGRFEKVLLKGPAGARVDAVRRIEARRDLPAEDFVIEG